MQTNPAIIIIIIVIKFFNKNVVGVTTPTPFVDFWQRSLYRARIAFLWGAMAISKNEYCSAVSAPIGVKFCTRLEGDNKQNRVGANFEFPPLKNLASL